MLKKAIASGLVDQKKLHMSLQYKLGLQVYDVNGNEMILNDEGYFVKAA